MSNVMAEIMYGVSYKGYLPEENNGEKWDNDFEKLLFSLVKKYGCYIHEALNDWLVEKSKMLQLKDKYPDIYFGAVECDENTNDSGYYNLQIYVKSSRMCADQDSDCILKEQKLRKLFRDYHTYDKKIEELQEVFNLEYKEPNWFFDAYIYE